jgi:chromosome partitioning protein
VVDELVAEGLPVLQPYLSSTIKVRESHERALPMIHLEPAHKLTRDLVSLHAGLASA